MKKYIFLILIIELLLFGVFLATPEFGLAQEQEKTVELFNPFSWVNVERPGELVVRAFAGFASLMALIAIAFVVFNGFKLMVAGSEEARNSAKQGLTWAVGGFVVALLAFTLVAGAGNLLGFAPSEIGLGEDEIKVPISGPEQPGDFISVMFFIMRNILGLLGFAATLIIIYYGYRYITAAGNEEAIEQAKGGLKWAILGLVVTLLAFTIITVIRQLLVFGP